MHIQILWFAGLATRPNQAKLLRKFRCAGYQRTAVQRISTYQLTEMNSHALFLINPVSEEGPNVVAGIVTVNLLWENMR